MMGKKMLELCKKLLCASQKPYIWEQTFCGVMKIGLQYPVSSAISNLFDYQLSSVNEVGCPIHPMLPTHKHCPRYGLSYTPTPSQK